MKLKNIFNLLKEAFQDWQEDKASRLAASLAYYTVFSLAPLTIIAIAIVGTIFGEEAARGEIVGQIEGLVGTQGAQAIETAIQNAEQPDFRNAASIINLGVLLFCASGVFAQLQETLNRIWEVKAKLGLGIISLIRKRFLSFSAVVSIGFLLMVSLLVSAALAALNNYLSSLLPGVDFLWQILNVFVSLGVITLLFALMYKYLPDAIIRWSDVWIGSAITAVLFTLGKYVLGLYLGRGSFGSTYGAAGSLVVVLAWVYYAAQILFYGAELTQVYAKRYGSRIIPDKHAVRMAESER